jgi:hypothetical protein
MPSPVPSTFSLASESVMSVAHTRRFRTDKLVHSLCHKHPPKSHSLARRDPVHYLFSPVGGGACGRFVVFVFLLPPSQAADASFTYFPPCLWGFFFGFFCFVWFRRSLFPLFVRWCFSLLWLFCTHGSSEWLFLVDVTPLLRLSASFGSKKVFGHNCLTATNIREHERVQQRGNVGANYSAF